MTEATVSQHIYSYSCFVCLGFFLIFRYLQRCSLFIGTPINILIILIIIESDLHEFDFISSQWSLVQTTGRRPRARYRATTVVYKNLLILYGGHDGTRHLSDTHIFDIVNRVWSPLSIASGSNTPIPRDSHIAVTHSNSMYIFGGSTGSAMDDLYELQLQENPSLMGKW
ncbi:MAG: hypothetical protein ACI8RD_014480 [Bacillariaceae sp.]|jgi:hypothetical protein